MVKKAGMQIQVKKFVKYIGKIEKFNSEVFKG